MIQGQSKTEANYRAIQTDSSSSLKDFSMDRKKYYKKYILGENVEEKDNQSVTIGRIVETLLLEPEQFDNRFYMSACANTPTGLMLDFVEALYRVTKEATDDFGVVTRTFDELTKDAYLESGFKIKIEQVISKFIGTDAEVYYNEIRKVRSQNLTVINSNDVTNADKIVTELRNNIVTRDLVNLVSSPRYTVLNQYQIDSYIVDGHTFKSMFDKLIFDHHERTVQVYDLKCTWSVENFYDEYYLYRRAYIQAYLYYRATVHLVTDPKSEWFGYSAKHPAFIVCDSTNYYNPLIYTLTEEDINDCYVGFEHKGRRYPGVKELIEDLDWALYNGVWNISRKNFENGGLVNIKGQ
ncbi:MAG: hypothetical protein EBR30_16470 [Cytophagia bacterium]|nr:hypothetical protein [Cytophagia bacterium]